MKRQQAPPGNYLKMFASILAQFGGSLGAVKVEKSQRQHDGTGVTNRRPLNRDHYMQLPSGQIVRRVPKRDKSISARQWRMQKKAERRSKNNARHSKLVQ